MKLKQIQFENFRGFENQTIILNDSVTVLYAGSTKLLQAQAQKVLTRLLILLSLDMCNYPSDQPRGRFFSTITQVDRDEDCCHTPF